MKNNKISLENYKKEIENIYKIEKLINIINFGNNLIIENSSYRTLMDKKKDKKLKRIALLLHHTILKNYDILKKYYHIDYYLNTLLEYAFKE